MVMTPVHTSAANAALMVMAPFKHVGSAAVGRGFHPRWALTYAFREPIARTFVQFSWPMLRVRGENRRGLSDAHQRLQLANLAAKRHSPAGRAEQGRRCQHAQGRRLDREHPPSHGHGGAQHRTRQTTACQAGHRPRTRHNPVGARGRCQPATVEWSAEVDSDATTPPPHRGRCPPLQPPLDRLHQGRSPLPRASQTTRHRGPVAGH